MRDGEYRLPLDHIDPAPLRAIDPLVCDSRTILFGDGGVGKGYVACVLIAAMIGTQSLPLPMVVTDSVRFGVLDFEDNRDEWHYRLASMGVPTGTVPYRESKAFGPKSRAASEAHKWADGEGVDIVVVDSVIPAMGGVDVALPQSAEIFRASLAEIDRASLALAHTVKKGNDRYPYGSVTWHNNARLIWRIDKASSDREHLSISLTNTKASRWAQEQYPLALDIDFDATGLATTRGTSDGGYRARKALVEALAILGTATIIELARETEATEEATRKLLKRNPAVFEQVSEPKRGMPALWRLRMGGHLGDTLGIGVNVHLTVVEE